MIGKTINGLRDYLAARDLTNEVAGSAVGGRLPYPLPARVRSVAVQSLVVFGALFGAGAVYVAGGALAVVTMPLTMGRAGVGAAMITLFTVCTTAIASGIMLLAARSAARVVRRERVGVRSLQAFATAGIVINVLAFLVTLWLRIAFFADGDASPSRIRWSTACLVIVVVAMVFLSRTGVVMRRYDRGLTDGH